MKFAMVICLEKCSLHPLRNPPKVEIHCQKQLVHRHASRGVRPRVRAAANLQKGAQKNGDGLR